MRSIFNFAIGKYEDSTGRAIIQENPVWRLSQTKAWYKVERRQTYIKDSGLGPFLDALDALRSELAASSKTTDFSQDILELILYTGLRKNEAAGLKWGDVEWLRDPMQLITKAVNFLHHEPHALYPWVTCRIS